ncbi:MAG: hypothetical protein LBS20_14950 [Prevotella sp.]|jgi:hypothetical protein|nr:hypothetical protein [Prevotella sp.]
MNKITLLIIALFLMLSTNGYAQGITVKTYPPEIEEVYVGSLPKDKDDGNNCHKLKIEVMGGNFGNVGSQTYSIATRGGYNINKELHGGNVALRYHIKAYENGNNIDFTIKTTGEYTLIWIQSWAFGNDYGITAMQPVNIVKYNSGGKTDVTSSFTNNPLFVSNSTNVGIGTDNPQSELDVAGTIRSKEVKIEATGWSDFVFNKNYDLPKLSEVEKHINEKQHLPGIPSEKEVLENGISVGEMQAKLLQKIEELTLYIIEQDKQNKDLQKQIDELKVQLKNVQP